MIKIKHHVTIESLTAIIFIDFDLENVLFEHTQHVVHSKQMTFLFLHRILFDQSEEGNISY
jgi:hypothetical protein